MYQIPEPSNHTQVREVADGRPSRAGTSRSYDTAVWPWPDSDVRYDDPVDAARGFSTDFVGFEEPIVGDFMAGDSRSGEVEVRPRENGPVTLVLVRQLGPDDSWWVIGAATDHIVIDAPEPLAAISSPLTVTGSAWVFEGTVDVEIRVRDQQTPVATGFVTGGGTEMMPFEGTFDWDTTPTGPGALTFLSRSAEDGSVWEATVIVVSF